MIVKNGYSIILGNTQHGVIIRNPKRKKIINNGPTPPEPDNSDIACLNLTAGLYKKKYEGYFYDINEFFDSTLVSAISIGDINKSYQILDIGTSTQQDWYSWGFIESPQYSTTEALGSLFPSIGKGVTYLGGGPIENAGTANLGPVLVSESVSSQIDDTYPAEGQNNKSLIIKGYFKPTVNGVYKFRLTSDDASYLWFGNNALDGNRSITRDGNGNVTATNAVVSLPGQHDASVPQIGQFTMTANSYYPLTVEFGNGEAGPGVLIFEYMPPGSNTFTSDLAGKLFYDVDSKGHRVCPPPSAYFGRVLSLDAVPYDRNPNQVLFTDGGVITSNGVYVYTQTGAPIFGSMFHDTGFYGPVVSGKNNFVELDAQYGTTGYFVRDWALLDYPYFNSGNIPFVNRVEVANADFNVNDTYARLNSGDNTFLSINENNRRIVKNQNSGWNLQDDDGIVRYTNDDINLNPNGWYYDYTNTVTLNDFYGYVDGTVYTHQVTITNGGTFDDAYTRVASSDTETVYDNNINYIPFANGTKIIASKGEDLNLAASVDAFRGWYLYDSALSDGDFPRYGINTDDVIPTTLPAYTSVKSFKVSGLTNIADDGVYSRSAGGNTPFTKVGSNPIKYGAGEDHGWRIWTYVDQEETAIYKLSNSAEITTGGWQKDFVDKIVFSGANNIANGTYIWQNQYANEEESRVPVLTVLGSGGTYENRGWRISATYDFQTNNLALQSPPQTTWWDGYGAPVWYFDEEFGNPIGMQTIMTSEDRGLTWTSPYIYQFNLNGFTGPHAAYNKTYKFTSAGSLIPECGSDQWISANRIYYGNNMFYDIDANLWRLQFLYTYSNNDDTFNNIITLQKTGPSPVGTWTSINLLPCESNYDPLIIGGTIVGSNAIAISAGSGTFPTLSIFEIEYVSGDGNYLNPTLTSQIGGDTISVDGTYTRNRGGTTSFSNGSINYFGPGSQRWEINVPGGYNNGAPFANEDFNLTENNWFAPNDESFLHVGTSSYTTARYYPANKTDGLLGIQYSGYFGNDPTWFNTASVKPIINELYLNHPTSDMAGPYIKIGDQNNQGTSYFQGTEGNAGWAIYYHSAFPASESYWYLQANIGGSPIHSKSNDLTTWTMTPEAIEEYGDEGAPTTTITQTQNFENSTNFGVGRALSNDTSWQWVGYFRANDTSNHNFYLNADEDAYFWFGDKASNGYTTGNADIYSTANNGSSIINLPLTSGTYYPVRLQWGHPGTPTQLGLGLSYRNGIQGNTYDFSGLFFNFTGNGIATNSNGYFYDFTLGEWQSTSEISPSLLLHMNGTNGSTTFTDNSPNNFTITASGNAQISTTESKFGGAAGYFDGIDSVLVTNDISLSTQDFTLECWIYLTTYGDQNNAIFNQGNDDNTGAFLVLIGSATDDRKLIFYADNDERFRGTTTIPLNTWTNITVTKQSNIYYFFINGVLEGTHSATYDHNQTPFKIGDGYGGVRYFNGYIDEVRITKGIARYTSNFTPANQPFTLSSYDPAPNAVYSHVWLDSISGFVNSGITYTGNKHVTLANNPTYSSDYSGIYSFNGVDQYAITQEVVQSADRSFSHFTWFKPTGAGVIISELGQPEINNYYHDSQLEINEAGEVHFGVYAYNGYITSDPIDFNRWYHLGLTYSSGVLSAYIDGQKIASNNSERYPASAPLYYGICAADSTNMGVGGYGKGFIGSFQAYNTGLTEIQVGNLYSGEKDRFPNIDNMFFPSLWLDASTGVNKFDYNYISQIVLTGDASVTGTYNASSDPTYNFQDERLNDYSLGNISYGNNDNHDGVKFRIITENLDENDIGYESDNGINWNTFNSYTSQFIITGFTGIYTGANGTYYNNGHIREPAYETENGQFQLSNDQLIYLNDYAHYPIIATKNNDGSFTPTNFITSITLFGASTTSVNGVYTRTAEEYTGLFTGSEGRSINFNGYGEWYVNPGAIYSTFDFQSWYVNNDESEEQIPPTASFAGTVRNIGSPRISSSVSNPNGSITGTITTSNVVTDLVTSWNDQSNNGNNATAYNSPELITNELNGKSVISFNGSSSYLEAGISLSQNQDRTIFIVGKYNDINAGQQGFLNLLGDGPEGYVFKAGEVDESYYYNGPAQIAAPTSVSVGNYHIVSISNNTEPNTSTMRINGVAGNNDYGEMTTRYVSYANIGSRNANQDFLNGSIAEIIIYNRGLTTSERQEVESYLTNKYAFSDTIYWGEDYSTACGQTLPIVVTGDGLTFCDSNTFKGQDLVGLGTGPIYISYNGQLKTVNHVNGDNFVTFNGGCGPCPSIPSAPNLSVIDGGSCGEVILQWDTIDGGLPITSYSWYNPFDEIGQEELINIGNNGLNASIIDQRFVDTSYSFKIKVQNELGTSEWSNIVNFTATTSNCSIPSAPYDLSVSNEDPDGCLLGLMYENPDDPQGNINYYELATNEDADNWTNIGMQGSNRDIAFIGLPGGETSREYFIRVRAVNSVGASPAVGPQSVILSKCI